MADRTCSVDGCEQKCVARGYCHKHWRRWRKYGDPLIGERKRGTCSIEGCDRPHVAWGWCQHHYGKWREHGDPLWTRPTAQERFWPRVNKDGPIPAYAPHLGQCWLWVGTLNRLGYGVFSRTSNDPTGAYRVAYEWERGPVPKGLVLDHLCRVPACVRPSHLEPVTRGENALRGETIMAANAAKTHCPAGHEYTPENTRIGKHGGRTCRACENIRIRDAWRRKHWGPERLAAVGLTAAS